MRDTTQLVHRILVRFEALTAVITRISLLGSNAV
jgi:hypothetical protein